MRGFRVRAHDRSRDRKRNASDRGQSSQRDLTAGSAAIGTGLSSAPNLPPDRIPADMSDGPSQPAFLLNLKVSTSWGYTSRTSEKELFPIRL